jgi:hypothetical protein
LIHGGLATKVNKKRRKIVQEAVCDICGREEETEFHAVVSCGHCCQLEEGHARDLASAAGGYAELFWA